MAIWCSPSQGSAQQSSASSSCVSGRMYLKVPWCLKPYGMCRLHVVPQCVPRDVSECCCVLLGRSQVLPNMQLCEAGLVDLIKILQEGNCVLFSILVMAIWWLSPNQMSEVYPSQLGPCPGCLRAAGAAASCFLPGPRAHVVKSLVQKPGGVTSVIRKSENHRRSAGENMTPFLSFLLIEILVAEWKSRGFFLEHCSGHLHPAFESWLAECTEKQIFIPAVLTGNYGVCRAGFSSASLPPTYHSHPLPRVSQGLRSAQQPIEENFPCIFGRGGSMPVLGTVQHAALCLMEHLVHRVPLHPWAPVQGEDSS